MNEIASIVFTYRNKNSNSYPVIAQQVPLSAGNVVMAQQVPLSAENVVMAQQVPLSAENVVPNNHDFQPGGPESQIIEGEYYQSDSAEDQNMPEGGTEAQYSSQMDGGNDQRIPEGGIELENQSADCFDGVTSKQKVGLSVNFAMNLFAHESQ